MPIRHRVIDSSQNNPIQNPRMHFATPYLGQSYLPWGQWLGYRDLFAFPQLVSRMTDVVGHKGGFNPVEQYTLSSSLMKLAPYQALADYGGPFVDFSFDGVAFPSSLPGPAFMDWPWLPDISTLPLSDWSIDASNAFTEQVPVAVSLPNFLYELKDMKGMIPTINRSSLSKTVSNNFLAFEFGVLPFVSDIKAILGMSAAVEKRLKHLRDTLRKPTRLSFNRSITYSDDYSFEKSLYDPGNNTPELCIHFRRLWAKSQFHVGASLYQDLKDLDSALATMKGLAASGGFNHPARVIWNAIPYSFVVDWFFHVGKLLDSLSIQPFGGEYNVSSIGYSIKTEASFYATQIVGPSSSGLPTQQLPVGVVTAKAYVRREGYPASSLFYTSGILTPMQLALSAAMLNQRRR